MPFKFKYYNDLCVICEKYDYYIPDNYQGYEKTDYLDLHLSLEFTVETIGRFRAFRDDSNFVISGRSLFGCFLIHELREYVLSKQDIGVSNEKI